MNILLIWTGWLGGAKVLLAGTRRVLYFLVGVSILIPVLAQSMVSAELSPQDKALNFPYYSKNASTCATTPGAPSPTGAAVAPGSNTYILGDSISYGLHQDGIEKKIKDSVGGDVKVNYDGGRSITAPGLQVHTTALAGADADKAFISSAKIVVIVLGTNQSDDPFSQNQKVLLDKLRGGGFSPDAKYFWVDIGATTTNQVTGWNARNKIIYDNASTLSYTVISRYKAIFGTDADPLNITPGKNFPGLGNEDASTYGAGNIHGAYPVLSTAILDALAGKSGSAPPTTPSLSGACTCKVSTALQGSDGEAQTFNFFISKGLTAIQAAAFMGNMQAEAHFEPRLVEYGWLNSRGEKSVAAQPSSLDDNVPPNQGPQGQPGYGIVQWTAPSRKQGLRDKVKDGAKASDMSLQLDYLWEELQSSYFKPLVLEPVKASTTIEDATWIVLDKFESPGDKIGQRPIRIGFANTILQKYGSGTTPATGGSSGAGSSSCGAQTVGSVTSTTVEYNDTARNRKLKTVLWIPAGSSPLPVVMFAHGFQKGPDAYERYIKAIAAKGYVVIAPSFPNADEHGITPLNRDSSLPQQPADIKFVLDQALKEPQLQGKIKPDSIAMVGHSDGAIDALRIGYSAQKDPRFKAIVAVSSDNIAGELTGGPALLMMHGDKDTIANLGGDLDNFKKVSANPKFFLKLLGSDHFNFVATGSENTPVFDSLTAAFLDNQLGGKPDTIKTVVEQNSSKVKMEQ